jgi:hypothetical protein
MRRRFACLIAALVVPALPAAAHGSATQESMFQDDDRLEFSSADTVAGTLNTLKALGVDRIRLSVFWKAVAPSPGKQSKPEGFDGANPDGYPKGAWDRYDGLLRLAQARGIAVAFDVTGPAPMWATGNPERKDIDETYSPDPGEFGAFVRAIGARYSGTFVPHPEASVQPPSECPVPNIPPLPPGCSDKPPPPPPQPQDMTPLPRVDYWEIWNEPNQAGWLTPQWLPRPGHKRLYPVSPTIYRGLADAMYAALQATGHGSDTILVGATAPKGLNVKGLTRSIKPMQFIKDLYCLDSHAQLLQGSSAKDRGCPTGDQIAQFPAAHPALFHMTGWSHHPSELFFPPNRKPSDPNYVTIANLGRLSDLMRRIFARYNQPQPGGRLPLYLTEFGYQTNPPDRFGVTPARQAAYLDQAEYLSWRNGNVRALSQFLLVDGGDPVGLTFQSGLEWIDGRKKPSYRAYRLPLWMPRRHAPAGTRVRVWGLARPAANGTAPSFDIEFRRRGTRNWRKLATRAGSADRGYLDTRIRLPGTGLIRLRSGGAVSRAVSVGRR